MEKRRVDTNSQRLGICQRLYNFIKNRRLISEGLKTGDDKSNEVAIEGSSSTKRAQKNLMPVAQIGEESVVLSDWERPKDYNSSSEIVVEFRHQRLDNHNYGLQPQPPPRSPALTDINQKSDAFILRQREALRRSSNAL